MNKYYKLLTLLAIGVITLTAGAKSSDNHDLPPMFLNYTSNGLMQMVYWIDYDEPDDDDGNHASWVLQQRVRKNLSKYTNLVGHDKTVLGVKYVDELLLDPDGEPLSAGELHGRLDIPSPGARYTFKGGPVPDDDESVGMVVVTDQYIKSHKPMEMIPTSLEEEVPLPPAVVKQMERKYGMTAGRSVMVCTVGNRYTYGIIQFEGEYTGPDYTHDPYTKKALALEVLTDGDKVYSYPVIGWLYDDGPTWNADDDGEYCTSNIAAAFEGPQGPELCFVRWAPESATMGMLRISDGELVRETYARYISLIDEEVPMWKTDIAEMKRQYVAEDPGENKHVELTKWTYVYIDDDGPQIWISDEEEENGAFFTREDGVLHLITTVRAGLKPSFHQDARGNYLMLQGHSGGPSYYYEVFKLSGNRVVEKYVEIDVYAEIESCYFNGEEISAEQGEAYMGALPEAEERYIDWHSIN